MSWPTPSDYQSALRFPARTLQDVDLAACTLPERTPYDLPRPVAGAFAHVYRLIHPDGRRFAVRLFLAERPGVAERLAALRRQIARLPEPPAWYVPTQWQQEGIFVAGAWRPLVSMPWIDGPMLGEVVESSLGEPGRLLALADAWKQTALALEAAGVVHGDLQRGNILLESATDSLRLIDYDGVWTREAPVSDEAGHPAYQHPRRFGGAGPAGDRLSALLIYTALRALAAVPELWYRLDNGDNLLFRPEDLRLPDSSRAFKMLRAALRGHHDELALVDALANACRQPLELVTPLSRL